MNLFKMLKWLSSLFFSIINNTSDNQKQQKTQAQNNDFDQTSQFSPIIVINIFIIEN